MPACLLFYVGEGGDELNDDTFGGSGPVGRDFDFAGQTAAAVGDFESSGASQSKEYPGIGPEQRQLEPMGAAWSSLDSDALLGPSKPASRRPQAEFSRPSPPLPQQQSRNALPSHQPETQSMGLPREPAQGQQPQTQRKVAKTLEEIEAEMMSRPKAQQPTSVSPVPQPHAPQHIIPQFQAPPLHNGQSMPIGPVPMGFPPGMLPLPPPPEVLRSMPPQHAAMIMQQFHQQQQMLQQQQQQHAQQQHRNSPTVPAGGPGQGMSPEQFQQAQQSIMLQNNNVNFPPLGSNSSQSNSRGGPLPPSVVPPPQGGNISPGNMSVEQLHTLRLNVASRPQTEETKQMLAELEPLIQKAESKRMLQMKLQNKWLAIAPYNNLMGQSEKDFITRIQISQLLNSAGPGGEHDPLKEDFYFTVFSAIKARREGPSIAPAAQGGDRNSKKGAGERRRQNQAMQKMANQVQRIVNDARQKPKNSQSEYLMTQFPQLWLMQV